MVHILTLLQKVCTDQKLNRYRIYRKLMKDFDVRYTRKLYNCLHHKDKMHENLKNTGVSPKTYIIRSIDDLYKIKDDTLWFLKPTTQNKGEGIKFGTIDKIIDEYKKEKYHPEKKIKS